MSGPHRATPAGPAAARALLAPWQPPDPRRSTDALRAAALAGALGEVYETFFPEGWTRFQAGPRLHGVRLARRLGRAVADEVRAAGLFPLLPAWRLDELDRRLDDDTEIPCYVWSIPFGDDCLYRVRRADAAGRLERILHALVLAASLGGADALAVAGLDPMPPAVDEPLAPLLAVLREDGGCAAEGATRLVSRDAERLYAWYGEPCPLIPALVADMQGDTGDPFRDWDEDDWDQHRRYAEGDPLAWDTETVAQLADLFRETRAALTALEPLLAALADPVETERLGGAIALAIGTRLADAASW